MPVEIVRNDITQMHVDAIVNAANSSLLGGGGVDGALHHAAGPRLLEECRKLNGCEVGQAKVTGAFQLPCKYVIHTVGPVWKGGTDGEVEKLASCYRRSLELAQKKRCKSIAFPLISTGSFGFPKEQALRIASAAIQEFLAEHEMLVYLVVFDKASFCISQKLADTVRAYIEDTYVDHELERYSQNRRPVPVDCCSAAPTVSAQKAALSPAPLHRRIAIQPLLHKALNELDESFSQMVLRTIDEKGISDVACYKKANLDRKLFSKLRSNPQYKPSKRTALALAVSLELTLSETNDLLRKAGYALSHSNQFDVIVEYFISQGNYDIMQINETLFYFDQMLLGA